MHSEYSTIEEAANLDVRTLLAFALLAALVGSGVWLTVHFIAKRRAYKRRMKGQKNQDRML